MPTIMWCEGPGAQAEASHGMSPGGAEEKLQDVGGGEAPGGRSGCQADFLP
jgi:hypothetical protein